MTPEERAKKLAGEFADFAEKYIWGADHIRYKGADDGLVKVVAAAIREAIAAERERCLGAAITVIRPESDPARGGYDAGWNDACEDVAHRIREGGGG